MTRPLVFGSSEQEKSLYRLNKDTGFSMKELSNYKHARTLPTLPKARVLACALGLPLDDLYFGAEDRVDGRARGKTA